MKIGNSGRFILVFETLPNFMLSALFFNSQAFVTVLTISTLGNWHFAGKTTQKWDVLKHVSSITKALDSSQACHFVMMSLTPNFKWYSSPRLKNPNWLPNLCGEKMSNYTSYHVISIPELLPRTLSGPHMIWHSKTISCDVSHKFVTFAELTLWKLLWKHECLKLFKGSLGKNSIPKSYSLIKSHKVKYFDLIIRSNPWILDPHSQDHVISH